MTTAEILISDTQENGKIFPLFPQVLLLSPLNDHSGTWSLRVGVFINTKLNRLSHVSEDCEVQNLISRLIFIVSKWI